MSVPFDISSPRAYLEGYRALAGFPAQGDDSRACVAFPALHSFVENPEGALEAAESMVRRALSRPQVMELDRSACTRVSGCAETLTAALAQVIQQMEEENKIELSHVAPRDPTARDLCDCFGLARDPALATAGLLTRVFRAKDKREMASVSMVTTGFLQGQLQTERYRLRPEISKGLDSFFIGEALDNSLAYGAGDCWVSTVVRKGVSANSLARVEFSIFNLGPSIDEAIMNGATTEKARAEFEALIDYHHAAGHFVNGWSPEALLVRQALQDRITSSGRRTGGIGTKGMISFYRELAGMSSGPCPECVIVSGTTYVRLTPKYRFKKSRLRDTPEKAKDIAFNKKNDLRLPADSECFTTLGRRLPGTLVTLQFTLDPTHLIKREVPR